jgi:hypothetical protein
MLKLDREYKEKMEMEKKMFEFVKEYEIEEKMLPKEMTEPLEICKEQEQTVNVENVMDLHVFFKVMRRHDFVTCFTHNFLISSHYKLGVHSWIV